MRLALVAATLAFISPPVFASSSADYTKFLQALEGDWQGQGNAMGNDGTGIQGSFDFEMSVGREGNTNTWLANTGRSTGSGSSVQDQITFYLAGQILEIDHESIMGGFTTITDSSDHSIDYDVSETQGTSFVDHYYHWDVSGNGLSGSVKVEVDGQEIYEESFQATKNQRPLHIR